MQAIVTIFEISRPLIPGFGDAEYAIDMDFADTAVEAAHQPVCIH